MSVSLVQVSPHLGIDVPVGGSFPSEAAGLAMRGGWHSQCQSSVSYLCVRVNWRRSGASVG